LQEIYYSGVKMKKKFLLTILIFFIFSCVSKPDSAIEDRLSENNNAQSNNATVLENIADTANVIDTETIRKKAREEFNKITDERLKEQEKKDKEEDGKIDYLKTKEVDEMLKDKQFMKSIEKQKK